MEEEYDDVVTDDERVQVGLENNKQLFRKQLQLYFGEVPVPTVVVEDKRFHVHIPVPPSVMQVTATITPRPFRGIKNQGAHENDPHPTEELRRSSDVDFEKAP